MNKDSADKPPASEPAPARPGRIEGAVSVQQGQAPSRAMAADPPAPRPATVRLPEAEMVAEAGEGAGAEKDARARSLAASVQTEDATTEAVKPNPIAGKNSRSGLPDADAPAASPALPRLIDFDSAQLGAIAHLYRGEVYRSTIWRTRLDNTTNWSIVMMGIALTSTFSSPTASALPLLVVGLLLLVFLVFEARRYRYFNIWRARARWIEKNLYAPMLSGTATDPHWREVLAGDYAHPAHHISFFRALGRRLRRNFIWILAIQSVAYWGKLAIHPFPAQDVNDLIGRAAVGPVSGRLVLVAGLIYNGLWLAVALWSWRADRAKHGPDGGTGSIG